MVALEETSEDQISCYKSCWWENECRTTFYHNPFNSLWHISVWNTVVDCLCHPYTSCCFVSQLNWKKQWRRGLTLTRSAGLREPPPSLWSNASTKASTRPSLPCSRMTPSTTEVRNTPFPRNPVVACQPNDQDHSLLWTVFFHVSHAEFEPLLSWSFWLIPQGWSSTDPSLVYTSTLTTECYDEQLSDKCLTLLLGTWYEHTNNVAWPVLVWFTH